MFAEGAPVVQSANVVGYSQVVSTNQSTAVGALFMPVADSTATTYDLNQITVTAANNKFMVPMSDFIQRLNPSTLEADESYTYISKEWLEDLFEEDMEDEYYNAIGWWKFVKNTNYGRLIEDGDYTLKCGATPIPVGTAFLGYLDKTKKFFFMSNGSVPLEATTYSVVNKQSPFFLNYLPTEIELDDIEVTCANNKFMVPMSDFIQVLDPEKLETVASYTYISKEWLEDLFEEDMEDEYYNAIGWWKFVKNTNYGRLIEDGDYTLKCGATKVPAGQAYLGYLDKSKTFNFKFPGATSVPSKAK